ncbi:MAG: sigma-70 family RNA polymerase sigma factor [Bdellovibrionota bacterium]
MKDPAFTMGYDGEATSEVPIEASDFEKCHLRGNLNPCLSIRTVKGAMRRRMNTIAKTERAENYLHFAQIVAKQQMMKFHAAPHYYDDYLSAAYSGLVEAASRYDGNTGVPFEKYAYFRVRGAIIDHIRQDSGQSKREYRALQVIQSVNLLSDEFWKINNYQPIDEDEELAEVLEFAAQGALIFRLNYLEHEDEITQRQEEIPCSEKQLMQQQQADTLRKAINQLPESERTLLQAFYFEGLSLNEIAKKRLEITRSWASRLHARALLLLKEVLSESQREQTKPEEEEVK